MYTILEFFGSQKKAFFQVACLDFEKSFQKLQIGPKFFINIF
jgi:hypothetical protein